MDAIEQAHMRDKATFDGYVKENQPGETQSATMAVIREPLGIEPMEHPFAYIKELQESFDYSQLNFRRNTINCWNPLRSSPQNGRSYTETDFGQSVVAPEKKFLWTLASGEPDELCNSLLAGAVFSLWFSPYKTIKNPLGQALGFFLFLTKLAARPCYTPVIRRDG